jgi:hypothetical protein
MAYSFSRVTKPLDVMADFIRVFHILFGERLVDNGHLWSGGGVCVSKIASQQHGNLQNMKKIRSHAVPAHVRKLFARRHNTIHKHAGVIAPSAAWPVAHERGGFNARQRA